MAISTIKRPSLLIPEYAGNIDTYNGTHLFVAPYNGQGTRPSNSLGNRFLILSDMRYSEATNNLIWGLQIAIGFGASKIAIRTSPYNTSGGTWSAWEYIKPS